MTVCNSCRYCEGLCAVFPAMEMRRAFSDGDLNYLANLCHSCGACYTDCQFSPPHEFNVNVPQTLAAYIAEIDRVCPCVILFHSQAGSFGFKAAQARPDKVKALIAIEPAGLGDPAKVDVLKNIPTLIVYGDYIEKDSRWPKIRANGIAFADAIKAVGGSVDVVDLPQDGIKGNSHMMMMDKNNSEVAGLIQKWLEGKGLTK